MALLRIEMELGTHGHGKVVVDGRDISSTVSAVAIEHRVGDVPRLVVSIPTHLLTAEIDGRVALDDRTRDALLALGWIPPGSATS